MLALYAVGLLVATFANLGAAFAVTCTWKATTANGWDNTGAWQGCSNGTGYPLAADTALFNGTGNGQCNIAGSFTVAALTLNGTFSGEIVSNPVVDGGSAESATLTVTGNFTQSTGTFNSTTYPFRELSVGGTASISGSAVFKAPRRVSITGAFTMSGGTFTGNASGYVKFGSTVGLSGGTFAPSGSIIATGAVTLSGVTYSSSSTVLVAKNNFSISSGTFNLPWLMSVGGAFSESNTPTFTAGTGTVHLTTASSPTHTFGGVSFNNLTVSDASTLSSGLVSYWKLDETGGTSAADSGSGGNNLTYGDGTNNKPAVDERLAPVMVTNNRSLDFDATENLRYTSMPSEFQNTNWGISVWFQLDAVDAAGGGCNSGASEIVNVGNDYLIRACTSAASTVKMRADLRKASGSNWTNDCLSSNTMTVNDGKWHHVVATHNGTRVVLYFDGVKTICNAHGGAQTHEGTAVRVGGHPTSGSYDFDGRIDEVRIYNRELTDAEALALYAGSAESAATVVHTASGNVTVGGTFTVGNGSFTLGSGTATFSTTTKVLSGGTLTTAAGAVGMTGAVDVYGTLTIGGGTTTASSSLTVYSGGTLKMNATSGILKMTTGDTLTIDGTLQTTTGTATPKPKISIDSGTYTFTVGSSATATPTLDIDGLKIEGTGADGMNINTVDGSSTTFTSFKNIDFASGGSTSMLKIRAASLSLVGDNLTFDTTSSTYNVKLEDSTGGGSDVRVFLGATCSPVGEADCEANDSDADDGASSRTANDGVPDDSGFDGPIAAWGLRGHTDTAGAIEGFPTAAFDWTTFAHWRTYVAFNNASGTTDRLYARDTDTDTDGRAGYYWDLTSGENFVGTPRWTTEGGVHYVYVLTANGSVYKLRDTGSAFEAVASPWDSPYRHSTGGNGATATSPLIMDASNNLYWAGNNGAGNRRIFSLSSARSLNGEFPVTVAADIDAVLSLHGTYLFAATNKVMGGTGTVYRIPSNLSGENTSTVPTSNVSGRISVMLGVAYFVENMGKVWALDANSESLTTLWSYHDTGTTNHAASCATDANCTTKHLFVDAANSRVFFGDKDGHVYGVYNNGGTGATLPGYPFRPGSSSDEFTTAPLYRAGMVIIGAQNGNVYFIDQKNGSNVPALIRKYELGSAVTSISYDRNDSSSGEYMIATANGRLFYVSSAYVSDPTSGSN